MTRFNRVGRRTLICMGLCVVVAFVAWIRGAIRPNNASRPR